MRNAFAAVLLSVVTAAAMAQTPPRVRMNIDDPKFDLAAYKTAVQVLKDRDDPKKSPGFQNDPVNWLHNSYNYFAKLHNDFSKGGGCIHGSEVFLPWHRELLNRFELALRAAKPGVTDNVTLPYWVWTENNGAYPNAFQDPTSPLYSKTRNTILKCSPGECPYTTDQLRKMLADNRKWLLFAGGACSVKPGCTTGNCSDCPSGDYGAFESPFHNEMHDGLGRPMSNPATAAQDPIFWSFHAYIDLIYQQWQCDNAQPPNCPDCNFRAMTDRRVKDVWDIEKQLGYVYDIVPSCSVAMPLVAAAPRALSVARLAARPKHMPLAVSTGGTHGAGPFLLDVTIPSPDFETAHVVISGLTRSTSFSYSGRVFLYPASMQLKLDDADFVSRHQAGAFAVWKRSAEEAASDEHAGHDTARVKVDVTNALRYLAQAEHGSAWRIAIVFDSPTSVEDNMTLAAAQEAVGFARAELVLNFDPKE